MQIENALESNGPTSLANILYLSSSVLAKLTPQGSVMRKHAISFWLTNLRVP